MKRRMKIVLPIAFSLTFLLGCGDLNLNPLSEGSSEAWFSSQTEVEMAVNDLYRIVFWTSDVRPGWNYLELTDDYSERITRDLLNGQFNSESGVVVQNWKLLYRAVARANSILERIDKAQDQLTDEQLNRYKAEARFARASMYSKLISYWGDVVFYTETMDIDEAFSVGRTDKATILEAIYADYDYAIVNLPNNSSEGRATKGAALALKARIALYNEDWTIARDAAEACIDLGTYSLHPDYGELFLSSTKSSPEFIFTIPRSTQLNSVIDRWTVQGRISRNSGGYGSENPSWELFCSYLCTDGLPIDESPLFNPHEPFKNRDPRCTETIVEFGSPHLGFIYQPHPDSLETLNLSTGNYQYNHDTRANKIFASYNGLLWRKGVDEEWIDDYTAENSYIEIRYADVLLMYAEAKTELGEIDQTVLDAVNSIRARAYKVSVTQTASYPAVNTMDQNKLMKLIRLERRVELAAEGPRYMDIIRWKLAEKVLTTPMYGMLDVAELRSKIVNQGLWFFPETPPLDEDGIADFSLMFNQGLIKIIAQRDFDPTRNYLWPIPATEILINENINQNPNY
tara:strand:+ start:3427 stop:5136 length:1710 start_codon:yes stop_codon:yes gene_type:complete